MNLILGPRASRLPSVVRRSFVGDGQLARHFSRFALIAGGTPAVPAKL